MLDILKIALVSITTFITTLIPQPTYTEGLVGQPVEFNPIVESGSAADQDIEALLFRGLVKHNEEGEFVADLAESWDISDDGKDYTFKLKKNLTFQDGSPLKSADVQYTLSRVKEFADVKIETVDEQTIKFHLEEPFAPFLELLETGIVPQGYWEEKHDPLRPIGSGDFAVVGVKKDKKVESITLATNKSEYHIRRIVFKFYDTHAQMLEAAKLGELQAFGGEMVPGWESFNEIKAPLKGRYYALFFNLNGPDILKDRDFRRDLARSIDKNVLVKFALEGQGAPINSPIAATWAQSNDVSSYKYEPNLDVVHNVSLTLTVPATIKHLKAADIIKESWSKIGVAVDIRPVAPGDILEKVVKPKDFEVLLFGQRVDVDPDRYAQWHSTQVAYPGLNFSSYEQMRVDKALEQGRKTLNRDKRIEHYANFQRVLTADVPAIFLYQPVYTFAVSEKVKGVKISSLFYPRDRFASFKDWWIE